jgi:type III restriction enzyme
MPQVVIENPILNSAFQEPRRHFRFSDDGITDEIVEARRISSYFIPKPKKKGKQLDFETEWTEDRIRENETINKIRERVNRWRSGGYVGVTRTTARLLEHWRRPRPRAASVFLPDRSAGNGDLRHGSGLSLRRRMD